MCSPYCSEKPHLMDSTAQSEGFLEKMDITDQIQAFENAVTSEQTPANNEHILLQYISDDEAENSVQATKVENASNMKYAADNDSYEETVSVLPVTSNRLLSGTLCGSMTAVTSVGQCLSILLLALLLYFDLANLIHH